MSTQLLVTFWGTRGSIATPGRSTEKYGGNTSCVSVQYKDQYFIMDAGTGIRPLGLEIMRDHMPEKGKYNLSLFLSHTHWDHIQGLPFFQPAYHPKFGLTIYGAAQKDGNLKDLLMGQMHSNYFPVPMSALGSDLSIVEIDENELVIGEVTVTTTELNHPGGATAFKLSANGKSVIYATDNELNTQFDNDGYPLKDDVMGKGFFDFIKGTDLLIADGEYTQEEYETKVGWGHSSMPVLINISQKAGVKQLAVHHHDPMHTDNFIDSISTGFLKKYQDSEPRMDIFWAREGLTLAI